jgi:tetratricopeptide (TPR) repeat protein
MHAPVRVSIATTAGLIDVERIAPVPLAKSKVFVWRGAQPMPGLSEGYDRFVRSRVARLPGVGRDTRFRLDLSAEIDTGSSWQLGALVAHALHRAGRLAGRAKDATEAEAGTLLIATGEIDFEMSVGEVGHVEEKLEHLLRDPRLLPALQAGQRVIVALPDANAGDGRYTQERLRRLGVQVVAASGVGDLLRRLDLNMEPESAAADDEWEGPPFRGLDVFDLEHRRIFWGRGRAREEAMRLLRRHAQDGCAFILIHGSSGVGKSSLARAGLLGDIAAEASPGDRWRTAVLAPSRGARTPLQALADALHGAVPGLMPDIDLVGLMLASPSGVAEEVTKALAALSTGGATRLALLVDQMEELLLWARADGVAQRVREREAFAEAIALLARTGAVWVLATVRSDLMSLVQDSPVLADLARYDRQYRLEQPRAGALAEIIRRPAELAGLRFEGRDADDQTLDQVLADAAKGQQDCLPLLQFTLRMLYERGGRQTGAITFAQYRAIGGLENAVSAWAEATVTALRARVADPAVDRAVDDVIFNLGRRGAASDVVVGADLALDTGFLTPLRAEVVQALDAARLIVLDSDPVTQQRTARVAHEALLTNWKRARALFEAYPAMLALKEDLERGAQRWQRQGGEFLLRGRVQLLEADALLNSGRVALSPLARTFVQESVAAQRDALESIKARLARDEQKVADLIKRGLFEDASGELERVCTYLADESDPELRGRRSANDQRRVRIAQLVRFRGAARPAFELAGEEEFERARQACMRALDAVRNGQAHWWDSLPTADLSAAQIVALRQDIYRLTLLSAGLELVPAIRRLFGGRAANPRLGRILPVLRVAPRAALVCALRLPWVRRALPKRMDDAEARDILLHASRTLLDIRSTEARMGGGMSATGSFAETLAGLLQGLADGPAGATIDYKWLIEARHHRRVEPVNAADYFYIGLLNYFIAKRRSGAMPTLLRIVAGAFPQIDVKDPLATAARLLRSAVALEPGSFWPHWALGRTLMAQGEDTAAELAFNAAIAVAPDYARGYEQRALALARQCRHAPEPALRARVTADLETAARLVGGDASTFLPRGEAFAALGDTAAALEAFTLWLQLEEDVLATVARRNEVATLDAFARGVLGRRRDAGMHADAHVLRAMVHWTLSEPGDAAHAAEGALRLAPGHARALALRGACLCVLGDPGRGVATGLEPALAVRPDDLWILYQAARALEACGRDARATWQALLHHAQAPHCPPWLREKAWAASTPLPRPVHADAA